MITELLTACACIGIIAVLRIPTKTSEKKEPQATQKEKTVPTLIKLKREYKGRLFYNSRTRKKWVVHTVSNKKHGCWGSNKHCKGNYLITLKDTPWDFGLNEIPLLEFKALVRSGEFVEATSDMNGNWTKL